MEHTFNKLLKAYIDLNKILLAEKVVETDLYIDIKSQIPSSYFNFTILKSDHLEKSDLESIQDLYLNTNKAPTIYLAERQQKAGLVEYLIRNGYKYLGDDTCMVYDTKIPVANSQIEITEIGKDKFEDFHNIQRETFSEFEGNDMYQNIIKKTLGKVVNDKLPDLISKAYVIYDKKVPASCGALLNSTQANFAYLHNAGTRDNFRHKGYQSALIRYRTKLALDEGIEHIFSLVEHGGQSWNNMIKCGFRQVQMANMLIKK